MLFGRAIVPGRRKPATISAYITEGGGLQKEETLRTLLTSVCFHLKSRAFFFFLRTHPVVSHPFSWSGVTAASWNQRTFPRSYYPAGVTAPITYCGSHRRRPCGGSLLNSLSLATFLRRTHRCCVSDIGCRRETAYFRFSFEDVSFFREGV